MTTKPNIQKLVKTIMSFVAAAVQGCRVNLENSIAAGLALLDAKAQIRHGEWTAFIRKCKLDPQRAQRLMRAATLRDEIEAANPSDLTDLSLHAALASVAKRKSSKRTSPSRKAQVFSARKDTAAQDLVEGEVMPDLDTVEVEIEEDDDREIELEPIEQDDDSEQDDEGEQDDEEDTEPTTPPKTTARQRSYARVQRERDVPFPSFRRGSQEDVAIAAAVARLIALASKEAGGICRLSGIGREWTVEAVAEALLSRAATTISAEVS